MLYIFDRNENLITILKNDGNSCPYFEAVHTEKLTGENTFTFSVPADHSDCEYVQDGSFVAFKDLDNNWQMFEILREEDTHEESKIRTFYCEHVFYELLYDFIEDKRPYDVSAHFALTQALDGTRWSVGEVADLGINSTNFYRESVLSAVQKVAQTWGGELRFRVVVEGGQISGRYVDLLPRRGADTGKQFVYSKDIKSIKREKDLTPVITAAYGYGKGVEVGEGYSRRITFADVEWNTANGDPVDKPLGQTWVGDPEALQKWGRAGGTLHRFGVFDDSEEEDPAVLLQKTWEYLQQYKEPRITYELDVIDLERLTGYEHERVRLGDTVRIIDREFKPELLVEARVIEINRNLLKPEETKIVLGQFAPSIVDENMKLQETMQVVRDRQGVWNTGGFSGPVPTSWLDGIIDTLQNEVRAGNGSVTLTNDNGIMIVDDPENPTKALRLLGGLLAISNEKDPVTGDWVWRTFGTGDGFTADLLNAGQIRTSLVQILGNSNFYWDGDYLYIINPDDQNQQIRLSKEGIRFTKDGGQTWRVAMDFDGIRMEGKSEDGYTHYTGDGVKVYDEVSDLVGHLGKFDTGQSQTVLTEDTQADFNTGTLTDVVATAAGNLELAKDGTDVSVTETTQADFQAGTLTNVVATEAGNLELQTIANPTFTRNSVAYNQNGQQVAAGQPRFEQGKFGKAVMVEEGTTNLIPESDHDFEGGAWSAYSGAIPTITKNQPDPFGGNKATRIQTSGGSHTIKYLGSWPNPFVEGDYSAQSVWVRVLSGSLVVRNHEAGLQKTITAGGWQKVELIGPIRPGAFCQFHFRALNVADSLDFLAFQPQKEKKPYCTTFTPSTRSPETLTIPTAGVLNPQEGTVEFWAHVNEYTHVATTKYLFATATSSSTASSGGWYPNFIGLRFLTTGMQFRTSDSEGNSSIVETASTLTEGWHYFAFKWSSMEIELFIDGASVGTASNPYLPSSLAATVYVGSWINGTLQANTFIDDLHISSRARTDEEILAAYQSDQPLPVDEWTTYKLPFDGNLKASKAGLRHSPVYNISFLDTATSSIISWNATLPTNTSLTIETNLSLDGGTNWQGWQVCTNGVAIPGITSETDLSNARLQLRQTLATNDTTITPQLHDVTINLNPPYKTAGYRESPAFGISGECRITWEATLNGQILAIQSNISRDGGTTWEGWQDCVNGGIIPGTDTGNLSNAKLKLKEILTTTDISKTPQLHKVVVSQPIYGYGLWSKNGYFVLNAPPVDGGIRVYDASGNLRTHIGQYAKGKYGAKVINGEIYSTLFQTGEEGASDYIKLSSGNEPLLVVNGNKNALSIWATGGGGFIQFFDPSANDMRGQILPHDDLDGVGLRVHARNNYGGTMDLSLTGSNIEMNGNVWVNNNFRVFGSKNAVVLTENYGLRALSVIEMPETKFMDEGIAELINGLCRIDLDPIFLETIEPNTPETPFIVHLTPYDWLTLRVKEIGDTYFIIEEKDGLSGKFTWQLTATRKGYAGRRLDRIDDEDVLTSNWEDDLNGFIEQEG